MGQITYFKCKVASLLYFANCGMIVSWRCATIKSFPSSGSHKHFAHFPGIIDQKSIFGDKAWQIYKLKGLLMLIPPPPLNISSPMLQVPMDESHLNFVTWA